MAGKKEEEVRKNRRFFSDIPPKNPVRGEPLPKHTHNMLKSVVKRCGTSIFFQFTSVHFFIQFPITNFQDVIPLQHSRPDYRLK